MVLAFLVTEFGEGVAFVKIRIEKGKRARVYAAEGFHSTVQV